jgi:hypothetical protein
MKRWQQNLVLAWGALTFFGTVVGGMWMFAEYMGWLK